MNTINQRINYVVGFHGTDSKSAKSILAGKIDVTLGQGELGRGFYLGYSYRDARTWAFYKSNQIHRKATIIIFIVRKSNYFSLKPLVIKDRITKAIYKYLKQSSTKGSFLFGRNVVQAPIVGGSIKFTKQIKWETNLAESTLNSSTLKLVIDDKHGNIIYLPF